MGLAVPSPVRHGHDLLICDESNKGVKLGNANRLVNHLLFMDDLNLYASGED